MARLVLAYLDFAELQANKNIPMTMKDWELHLTRILELTEYGQLKDNGKISSEIAKKHAETEFEKYRLIQDKNYKSDFDKFIELENEL